MNDPFWCLPLGSLYRDLRSGENGLSPGRVRNRLRAQLRTSPRRGRLAEIALLLFRQFSSPLVVLLLAAVLLSAMLRQTSDALIVLAILVCTGLLGFWQELNAGNAARRLERLTAIRHTVIRNGVPTTVATEEVVPGDIVVLAAGDIVPADCRIIESHGLHADESSLTGESLPAEKEAGDSLAGTPLAARANCLWKGTSVISGTARAIAVHTGTQSELGKLALALNEQQEPAFEKGVKSFGYLLLRATVVLATLILAANLLFGKPLLEAILFSLALAVGMAPELLPAIMTVAMSAGARRMASKKVIVKKLSSIFNLGEAAILCTDKTGTITEGRVTVHGFTAPGGELSAEVKLYAYLNSYFEQGFPNPIDNAIRAIDASAEGYNKTDELPYDFQRKRLSVVVTNGAALLITKGAYTSVLAACTAFADGGARKALSADKRRELDDRFRAYSEQGLRVLGVATRPLRRDRITAADEADMTFAGFILLEDPLKDSAVRAMAQLQQMSIGVKIITGDNRYAALHAAKQLFAGESVLLTGGEIERLSPQALVIKASRADVFAEIEPNQKERIIKALQKSGKAVAYIGDGINDVAAIHAADTGISTNNAVDVAREAADFVLLEKDLQVMADGVAEGRRSFVNCMKYINITTGATFGNMITLACASLLLSFLPMLPKQILLTNFITDIPNLAITTDFVSASAASKPGKWNLRSARNFMIAFGLHSSAFDLLTFFLLYSVFRLRGAAFQSGWFFESVFTEIAIIFVIRSREPLINSRPSGALLGMAAMAAAITLWLPYSRFAGWFGLALPGITQALSLAAIVVAYTVTAELLKRWLIRRGLWSM